MRKIIYRGCHLLVSQAKLHTHEEEGDFGKMHIQLSCYTVSSSWLTAILIEASANMIRYYFGVGKCVVREEGVASWWRADYYHMTSHPFNPFNKTNTETNTDGSP